MRRLFKLLLITAVGLSVSSGDGFAKEKASKQKKAPVEAKNEEEDAEEKETPTPKKGGSALEIFGKSAILVDARTGRILFQKNAQEQRAAASTQKLLTALIVAGSGGLTQPIVIETGDTTVEPTKLGIKPGESYTRIQLLRALLVKSGNDTAVALARDNAGSLAEFSKKMNRKAFELGAYHSNFLNPNGLPNNDQYSTAHDMSRIALACWRNPVIRSIITIRHLPFRLETGDVKTLRNTNRVLHNYPLCNGMKTGFTNAAGHCLIASASENERAVIAVVLGSNKSNVWNDAHSLLSYGLTQAAPLAPPPPPPVSP